MFVRGGLQGAELFIFDDLSSALDGETEQKLWDRLFAHVDRPACLVVSHRPAAVVLADHIIVLKDGQIEDEGPLDVLLAVLWRNATVVARRYRGTKPIINASYAGNIKSSYTEHTEEELTQRTQRNNRE